MSFKPCIKRILFFIANVCPPVPILKMIVVCVISYYNTTLFSVVDIKQQTVKKI